MARTSSSRPLRRVASTAALLVLLPLGAVSGVAASAAAAPAPSPAGSPAASPAPAADAPAVSADAVAAAEREVAALREEVERSTAELTEGTERLERGQAELERVKREAEAARAAAAAAVARAEDARNRLGTVVAAAYRSPMPDTFLLAMAGGPDALRDALLAQSDLARVRGNEQDLLVEATAARVTADGLVVQADQLTADAVRREQQLAKDVE